MKVIFLDFDGVLNSAASFKLEYRIRKDAKRRVFDDLPSVGKTLCHVCTSNFQHILDEVPDAKIVISSSWRGLFTLEELKEKLQDYHVDSSRVIGVTVNSYNRSRGTEIQWWLDQHPEVTKFVILDDNSLGYPFKQGTDSADKHFVQSTWNVGLTLPLAVKAITLLGGKDTSYDLELEF